MAEKQRILIVDDDYNIAELISLYLTKECFETKIVGDGEEALRVFPEFQPNLILLDLMLPGIDGVSGATITSDAVKQCMNDCITQAMGGTAVSAPEASEQAASWRTAPEAIPDSEITKTYDVDVAIIGMGYAGLSCYRELAEEGKNVLVLEAMPRESCWTE